MNALVLATVLAAASPDCHHCDLDPTVNQDDEHSLRVYGRSHSEISFGYLGQWSNETNRALELNPAPTDPHVPGSITDPFLGTPFSASLQPGATIETRFVYQHIRTTVGVRFPFINFRPSDTAQTVMIAGAPHEVIVRSVALWDFRTGIGFELPFRHVTPYVDVLGDLQTMETQLVIDNAPAKYVGRAFSLGSRVGLRIQMNHAFVALSAEATALGPLRVGGSAQLGFAF